MTRTENRWAVADGDEKCASCGHLFEEGEDMLITSTGILCIECIG